MPEAFAASCGRYTDTAHKALCIQLLAKLQQKMPVQGPRTITLDSSEGMQVTTGSAILPKGQQKGMAGGSKDQASTQYSYKDRHDHEHQGQREPWYNHGPADDDTPRYQQHDQQYRQAEDQPSGYQDPSGAGPPSSYPPDPPTPSIPLFLASQDQLDIRLTPTPENVNKTGRFTQADFQEWSVFLFSFVTLSDQTGPDSSPSTKSLRLGRYYACDSAAPLTVDCVGQLWQPTSLTVRCKLVQVGADVTAGAQFPWKQALEPRWHVTVPSPTTLFYLLFSPNENLLAQGYYAYDAAVSSIQSPVAFTGSMVQLMINALLADPSEYPFTVSANAFTLYVPPSGPRGDTDKGRDVSGPAAGAVPGRCDRLTGAVKQLCQQHYQRLAQPLRPRGRAVLPTAVQGAHLPGGGAASALDKARALRQDAYGRDGDSMEDNSYPSQPRGPTDNGVEESPSVVLIPQTSSYMQVHLEAPDMNINTTTGDLTDANFTTSSFIFVKRSALLSDEINFVGENALLVEQDFECVDPVKYYFSGTVGNPNYVRIQCKQEARFTTVIAGPKFPWGQAAEKRNEISISTPCQAYYNVNDEPPYEFPTRKDFDAQVTNMLSKLPFTGSIVEFLTVALFEPSQFAFDTVLASFEPQR